MHFFGNCTLFHSVSAFCNAGFSTLEGNLGNKIILGGIGFPILANFKKILSYYLRWYTFRLGLRRVRPVRFRHLAYLNTKIVISSTLSLILAGTVVIAIFEWNGVFARMRATPYRKYILFMPIIWLFNTIFAMWN